MGLTNIFGHNFQPIGQIFGQISTSENSKFEEILGKNCKIWLFFFSNVSGSRSKCQKIKKKHFSRSISPFKALKLILCSKVILNDQKWISKVIRIFTFRSKFSAFFGKDLQCFLEKNLKQKKLEKSKFWIFFYSIFFHENRQIGSKIGQKYHKHVFTPYKLFWKKNNLIWIF